MSIHVNWKKETVKESEVMLVFGGYEFRGWIPELVVIFFKYIENLTK